MHKFATLAVAVVVALTAQTHAEDAAAKELIDKAVKAMGGAEKAAGINSIVLKGKAKASEGGMNIEVNFEMSMLDFDRLRLDITVMAGGQMQQALLVMNGDKMWMKDMQRNKVEDAPKEVQATIQQFFFCIRMTGNLARLSTQKGVELAHGGEGKVNDTPAGILRVARKDKPDVNIFFDAKTNLPLKSESQIKEPEASEEKRFEFLYSDFKETDGVKVFNKIKIQRDGKEMVEMEFTEVKFGEKLEASTFDKPQ